MSKLNFLWFFFGVVLMVKTEARNIANDPDYSGSSGSGYSDENVYGSDNLVTTLPNQPATDATRIETTTQPTIQKSSSSFVPQSSTSNISFMSRFTTTPLSKNSTIANFTSTILTQFPTTNDHVETTVITTRNSTLSTTNQEFSTSPGGGSARASIISTFTIFIMTTIAISFQ